VTGRQIRHRINTGKIKSTGKRRRLRRPHLNAHLACDGGCGCGCGAGRRRRRSWGRRTRASSSTVLFSFSAPGLCIF
jgi:hypothetical protein